MSEEKTQRIRAAVAACEGIPTAALEAGVVAKMVEAARLLTGKAGLATWDFAKHGPSSVAFRAHSDQLTEAWKDLKAALAQLEKQP